MNDTSSPPEHWLILAHCFNMDGRAASQTITDRIPLLMAKGIIPVVVSAPTGYQDQRFPHYRSFSPTPSCFLFEVRHVITQKTKSRWLQQTLKALLTIVLLPLYIPEKILIHLDSQWSWFISASWRGYSLIQKYSPPLLYTTAGPPTTHLAGYFLHKITGLPWLAELHDPLVIDSLPEKGQRGAFNRWLEKTICQNASAVIFFTETALTNACQRNPEIENKGYILRPGAAPPDFSSIYYQKKDRIHFGHFGSLASTRNLGILIKALAELIRQNPSWHELISLDIYGSDLDPVSEEHLKRYPLHGILKRHGRLEFDPNTKKSGRQRVMEAMCQSDILLIVHGVDAVCDEYIPSKLYEYLLTRRPILGLAGQDTELEKILKSTDNCYCVPQEIEMTKKIMTKIVLRWQEHGLPDRPSETPFTIEAAVDKLLYIAQQIRGLDGQHKRTLG